MSDRASVPLVTIANILDRLGAIEETQRQILEEIRRGTVRVGGYLIRDAALRRAFAHVRGRSLNARVEYLAAEIKAFRVDCWPTWQFSAAAPPDAGNLRAALFDAFKATNGRVPGARRLRYIVDAQ